MFLVRSNSDRTLRIFVLLWWVNLCGLKSALRNNRSRGVCSSPHLAQIPFDDCLMLWKELRELIYGKKTGFTNFN